VYWLYSVLVSERVFGIGRDEMLTALQRQGIETRPLFPPVHTQPIYGTGQHLPVAERLACDGLSLPSAANLTHEDVSRVAASIKALSASRQRTAPR
jgi:perosamine synthetase